MKVATAVWENHVSSALDVCSRLLVMELRRGGETSGAETAPLDQNALAKVVLFRELGMDVLICGAVLRRLALASEAWSIRLPSDVTGKVDDVLNGYRTGQPGMPEFMLPGWWPGAKQRLVPVASPGQYAAHRATAGYEAWIQVGVVPPTGTESERSYR